MADIKTITVNGITYNVKDDTSFSASGGTLTGPLTLAGAPTYMLLLRNMWMMAIKTNSIRLATL